MMQLVFVQLLQTFISKIERSSFRVDIMSVRYMDHVKLCVRIEIFNHFYANEESFTTNKDPSI